MSQEKRAMNPIRVVGAILILFGIWIWGFAAGSLNQIVIPSEIIMGVDESAKELMESGEYIADTYAAACKNITHTCECNLNSSELYVYAQNSYREAWRLSQQSKVIVHSFCKSPKRIGEMYLKDPLKYYFVELNKPIHYEGFEIEVVGGNADHESVVLSINGARQTLVAGDTVSNGKISIYVVDVFMTNIPTLDVTANLEIKEVPQ